MSTVTEIEAKNRFSELLERVRSGEEVLITSEKDASVRMALAQKQKNPKRVKEAVAELRELQNAIERRTGGERISYEDYRSALEEGRK
jgi:antitoxin (DNA-binding transcriptional repressor) of toxin-antitoxin stability system